MKAIKRKVKLPQIPAKQGFISPEQSLILSLSLCLSPISLSKANFSKILNAALSSKPLASNLQIASLSVTFKRIELIVAYISLCELMRQFKTF